MKHRSILTAGLLLLLAGCAPRQIRILYWNIQNGMWADQENHYDNFVRYVTQTAPDICIWCEAKTHYRTGEARAFPDVRDSLYLPAHWEELAARYGHRYVFVGGERDFFPQVITSRFPLEGVLRMTGDSSVTVSHGAGWARVFIGKDTLNLVTVHTWPQKYGLDIPKNPPALRKESASRHEGDSARFREMRWVVEHTVGTDPRAAGHWWLLAGDMNSVSRADNNVYGLPEDSPEFLTQDYMAGLPYLTDIQREQLDTFAFTGAGNRRRIDYLYATPPVVSRIKSFRVVRDGYPANRKAGVGKFWTPSDHSPLVLDLEL